MAFLYAITLAFCKNLVKKLKKFPEKRGNYKKKDRIYVVKGQD